MKYLLALALLTAPASAADSIMFHVRGNESLSIPRNVTSNGQPAVFVYAYGKIENTGLGTLDIVFPHFGTPIPGEKDFRRLEGDATFRADDGSAFTSHVVGRSRTIGTTITINETGVVVGGTGKFANASGTWEGNVVVDTTANPVVAAVDYLGTINLDAAPASSAAEINPSIVGLADAAVDRTAIQEQLLYAYAYTYDSKDCVSWSDLFATDAVLEVNEWKATGRDAILQRCNSLQKNLVGNLRTRHNMMNIVFDQLTPRRAEARTYVVVTGQKPGEQAIAFRFAFTYQDVIVKSDDGRWLFQHRKTVESPPLN